MSSALHLNITPASPLSKSAALQVQVVVVRIRIRVSDLSRPTILFSPLKISCDGEYGLLSNKGNHG